MSAAPSVPTREKISAGIGSWLSSFTREGTHTARPADPRVPRADLGA